MGHPVHGAVRIVKCHPGELYFPWNYRQRARAESDAKKRVTRRAFKRRPGEHVFNAVDASGQVLGSMRIQLGPRAALRMIETEEFAYGGGNHSRGPYLWPDDHDEVWILIVHGIWVRAAARRTGVATAFMEYVRRLELPVYVAFGNNHMERWCEAEFRPDPDAPSTDQRLCWALFEIVERPPAQAVARYEWKLEIT